MFNKKGQTAGLITGLVFGVASLVIGVIIAFVIVSTLTGADLLEGSRTTGSVSNETGYLNITGYQLTGISSSYIPGGITLTAINNGTDVIELTNATVSSTGLVTNITDESWDGVANSGANFTYTYSEYSVEELATDRLSANFTAGVDNVSGKIPTVLLVAAIVLILGVLALLIATWQRMRVGGSGI